MIDGYSGDDAVENHRQGRGEEEPEAPRGSDEAERKAFGIFLADQGGQDDPAEREDGDAARAGESGEEGADERRHHREAPGHPAEPALCRAHQPPGRAPFGEHVPGHGEQRDGGERRRDHEPEGLRRDGSDRRRRQVEEQQREARHHHEHGSPEQERGEQEKARGRAEARGVTVQQRRPIGHGEKAGALDREGARDDERQHRCDDDEAEDPRPPGRCLHRSAHRHHREADRHHHFEPPFGNAAGQRVDPALVEQHHVE